MVPEVTVKLTLYVPEFGNVICVTEALGEAIETLIDGMADHVYPLATVVPVFAVTVVELPAQIEAGKVNVGVNVTEEVEAEVSVISSTANDGSAPVELIFCHLKPIFTVELLFALAGNATE